MITASGKNLSIVISAKHNFECDWQSYCCYRSLLTHLPEANISILCVRQHGQSVFNWAYRNRINFFQHSCKASFVKLYQCLVAVGIGYANFPILIIDSDFVAVRQFSQYTLKGLTDSDYFYGDGLLYLKNASPENVVRCVNTEDRDILQQNFGENTSIQELACKSTENEIATFIAYGDKCGNFDRTWGHRHKDAPFFYVNKISKDINLTLNERYVLNFWNKIGNSYNTMRTA